MGRGPLIPHFQISEDSMTCGSAPCMLLQRLFVITAVTSFRTGKEIVRNVKANLYAL